MNRAPGPGSRAPGSGLRAFGAGSRRGAARSWRGWRGWRGWLTLLVLGVVVGVVSIGPTQLRELLSGVFYSPPPAATLAPAPTHADSALRTSLEGVANDLPRGHLGAVAVDLQGGATASVDAARSYPAASLFKLPILMAVLDEQDSGRLAPDRQLEIQSEDWTDGSGVLQARVGDHLAVSELTRLMIEESDNIAALVLLDVVGVPRVNALTQHLGLQATHVVDHRAGEPGDHTTSAQDMAQLMVLLATGQAVNQHVSEQALGLLAHKQNVAWLRDNLPFWVKVAHKWGDLPEARNDVGIVYTPRGSYVIAVLVQDALPDEAATAIARASRVTYDFLGNR